MSDEALRGLLRQADPAASLAPAVDDDITRLTEEAMSTTRNPETPRTTPARGRAWIFGGIGALGAAAAAAIAIPLVFAPAASVTTLTQPSTGGPTAMCAELTPEFLTQAQSAFRANVTSTAGGTVTLQVTERFTGEVEDTVQVAQGTSSGIDGEPITFENGATYLIATNEGRILTCGTSGVDTTELAAIYAQAFPG